MESRDWSDPGQPTSSAWEKIGFQSLRIDELMSENAALREELAALRNRNGEPEQSAQTGRLETITTKYNDLAKRYHELQSNHARCKPYVEKATKKWNEAKENALQWKAYYEKCVAAGRIRSRPGHERPISPSSAPSRRGSGDAAEIEAANTPRPPRNQPTDSRSCEPRATLSKAEHDDRAQNNTDVKFGLRSQRITSSQTTDTGSENANAPSSPMMKREPSSDDEPVVVSARSLKRKRASTDAMLPPVCMKQERDSPERPFEIKSEEWSSPAAHRHQKLRQEISDLDAVDGAYLTPRKRRSQLRALSEEVSRPARLATGESSLSDGARPGIDPSDEQEVSGSRSNGQVNHSEAHPTCPPLQPLSVNIVSKQTPAKRRRRQSDKEAAAKAALLSEDGDVGSEQQQQPPANHANQPMTMARRRLETMLDEPAQDFNISSKKYRPHAEGSKVEKSLTPVSTGNPSLKKLNKGSSGNRQSLARERKAPSAGKPVFSASRGSETPPSASRQPLARKNKAVKTASPPGIEESPPPPRPEDEGLRNKPLSALRLEDFKINPKFTGTEFAIADTFRGREQRRCLPGCTKPECCGDAFLQAAEAAGNAATGISDSEALASYLGANWQEIIGACEPNKRDAMLKRARAAAFANKFGKHRQAFERRSTPPGFWRTEMPTTQEEAEDREKARQMIRQKVEERWREAMREGDGRWLFRDE